MSFLQWKILGKCTKVQIELVRLGGNVSANLRFDDLILNTMVKSKISTCMCKYTAMSEICV